LNHTCKLAWAFILCLALFAALPHTVQLSPHQDQTTIQKDSIQITAFTVNFFKGNYDNWSWLPRMQFRVNGPIESGSQLYAEFSTPTGPWVKFDCDTGTIQKGYWWKTECGGRDAGEDKGIQYTGVVNFNIKMRNELAGTDTTLFSGKMKVAKAHSNEAGPKAVNKWVYFINNNPDRIRRVSIDGGAVEDVPGTTIPNTIYGGFAAHISPDGSKLAFVLTEASQAMIAPGSPSDEKIAPHCAERRRTYCVHGASQLCAPSVIGRTNRIC